MTDMTELLARIVRPLVWEAFGNECVRVESVIGRYEIIWGFHNGQTSLDVPAPRRNHTWHPTLAAAQAAAETDYRARICAALNLDAVVALVEAGRLAEQQLERLGFDGFASGLTAALAAFTPKPETTP